MTYDNPAKPTNQTTRKPSVRRPRPRSKATGSAPVRKPLLTIQWRVYKQKKDGPPPPDPVNPNAVFHPGDMLQFIVTANQDGYLYVVHEREKEDGKIIVPDSRVRGGQNFVRSNEPYALPAPDCADQNPLNCFYVVTKEPVKEFYTVIFTRSLVLNPWEQFSLSGNILKRQYLDNLLISSNQKIRMGNRPATAVGSSPYDLYSLWVTNIDAKDDERIVFRVPINKSIE